MLAAAGSILSLSVTIAPTPLPSYRYARVRTPVRVSPFSLITVTHAPSLGPLLWLHPDRVLRHQDFTTSTATYSDRQSLLSDTLDTRRSIAPLVVGIGTSRSGCDREWCDEDPPPGNGTSSSLPYHRMEDDEKSG